MLRNRQCSLTNCYANEHTLNELPNQRRTTNSHVPASSFGPIVIVCLSFASKTLLIALLNLLKYYCDIEMVRGYLSGRLFTSYSSAGSWNTLQDVADIKLLQYGKNIQREKHL